jgi:hypothetical protein
MPLNPVALAESLKSQWLEPPGGFPANVQESGDRFAACVAPWFATSMAAAFPCATAVVRQSQLAGQSAAALGAGLAPLAGAQLALALVAYMAGQSFGAGISNPPAAAAPAQAAFAAVFADMEADAAARAQRIALATWAMALSTIVVFPPVISPPVPVL